MSGHFGRVTLVAFCVAVAGCGSEHPSSGTSSTGSTGLPTGPRVVQGPEIPSSRYTGIAQGETAADPGAKVSIQFDAFHAGQEYLGAKASLAFETNEVITLSGRYDLLHGGLALAGSGWAIYGHLVNGRFVGPLNHSGAGTGSWSAAQQSSGVLVVLGSGRDANHTAVRFDFYVTDQTVAAFLLGDSQAVSLSGQYDVVHRIVRFRSEDGTTAGSGLVRADGSAQGSYDVAGFGKGTWAGS